MKLGRTRLKRSHTAAQTTASVAKHKKTVAAAVARKRKRAVRYVEAPQLRAATGAALARLMTVGEGGADGPTERWTRMEGWKLQGKKTATKGRERRRMTLG